MNNEWNVIWKEGDGEMPPKAKHVVDAARGEMLLKSLNLPDNVVNEIRCGAKKNNQSIVDYISSVLIERLVPTQVA